jgi:predicted RND superfamily exporter protein
LIFCGIGLARLRTKIDVVSLLSADNPAVRNFRWFEQHIGPLVPVELVIHFDHECPLTTVDRLKVVSAVQRKISQIEILEGDMSAVTFIPRFPRGGGLRGTVRQTLFRRQVERSRDDLIAAKYLAETEKGEAWRISGRIVGQVDFDYGQFLDRLREKVDPILAKLEASGHSGVTSICTGVTAVVYQVQEKLLGDLFNSFLTALLLVAIVMMIALRSVTCGLLAMMPNVFPTILVFGCMGWTDRALDIGSVMTASVALGIAVDGTFHYLKWFVHSLKQGESRQVAIAIAYQRCGRALVQTTIICASGLLIFTFSGFLPARNFAWMLLMMLVVALFGDLVLLPALLAGSLGRILSRICRPPDGVLTTAETTTTLTQNIKTV